MTASDDRECDEADRSGLSLSDLALSTVPENRLGLIVAVVQAAANVEQLELGMCGYQAFAGIEHINGMTAVARHHSHTDASSAIQVV